MENFRKNLPSLTALMAFEAAARLQSFTEAARELCLSQAAVSKQIKALEQNLKQQLFSRAHRRVELTPEGRAFLHTVSQSLRQIASAAAELRMLSEEEPVTVSVGHSFAFLWLIRRLPAFLDQYPQVKLDLQVLQEPEQPSDKGADLTIIAGDGSWAGFQTELLFSEHCFPVCSPRYLRRAGDISDPAALLNVTLLELDDAQPACMTWRTWLTAHNVPLARSTMTIRMDSFPLVVEAARAGLGVALGWRELVEPFLKDGTLVRPLEQELTTEIGYYAAWRSTGGLKDPARLFLGWLHSQIRHH